jgi:hypothetical protein
MNVIVNSAKRGWSAQNERSKAPISGRLGRLGRTPCVSANSITSDPTETSKSDSTKKEEVTAGYVEFGTLCLAR